MTDEKKVSKPTKKNGGFDQKRFIADIIAKREKEGLSLDDMAKQTKLHKATCYRIEAGSDFYMASAVAVCNWLGRQVQYYLTK